MLDKFIEYLRKRKWRYLENKEDSSVAFNLSGEHGTYRCYAQDEPDKSRFILFSYCMVVCPEDKRIRMSELLMRLNITAFFGNFELNFETGDIKFKKGEGVMGTIE